MRFARPPNLGLWQYVQVRRSQPPCRYAATPSGVHASLYICSGYFTLRSPATSRPSSKARTSLSCRWHR